MGWIGDREDVVEHDSKVSRWVSGDSVTKMRRGMQ